MSIFSPNFGYFFQFFLLFSASSFIIRRILFIYFSSPYYFYRNFSYFLPIIFLFSPFQFQFKCWILKPFAWSSECPYSHIWTGFLLIRNPTKPSVFQSLRNTESVYWLTWFDEDGHKINFSALYFLLFLSIFNLQDFIESFCFCYSSFTVGCDAYPSSSAYYWPLFSKSWCWYKFA